MTTRKEIDLEDVAGFDPGANRVEQQGNRQSQTESGGYASIPPREDRTIHPDGTGGGGSDTGSRRK